MRKVLYVTELNNCEARSLRELRTHVEFFTRVHQSNNYDDDYVQRFVMRDGEWICDDSFLARISLVNGRAVFRRVKISPIPDSGFPV